MESSKENNPIDQVKRNPSVSMKSRIRTTINAIDEVLQTLWGEILEDQDLSKSQIDRLQKASDLIQEVKAELEVEEAEENEPPPVPQKCCKYCGNRETREGLDDYFCPIQKKAVSAEGICDSFKYALA
ncbi:MAG: hypothetical protein LBQ89_08160 [Treponema sp.]|jgi:hypothetical protein|nr:hypothetical protein [Treponema sp.]